MATEATSAAGLREQAAATPNAITALELRVAALELDVVGLMAAAKKPAAVAKPTAAKKAAATRARKRK